MIQKRNISTLAIVAALSILLVPSTSQANFNRTHTPGETVGPSARPPIKDRDCIETTTQGGSSWCSKYRPQSYRMCEVKLIWNDTMFNILHPAGVRIANAKEVYEQGWDKNVGLGRNIRYIQATGGYCYYYKAGKSSGASGPNTWRYDPS